MTNHKTDLVSITRIVETLSRSFQFRLGYESMVYGKPYLYDGYDKKTLMFHGYGRLFAMYAKIETGKYAHWYSRGLSPHGKILLYKAINDEIII